MADLECRGPEGFHQRVQLKEGDVVTTGRSPDNTITLGGSALSRNHAKISLYDGVCFVEDLGSSNGTFLNGNPLDRPVVVLDGDVVSCGELEIKFSV